MPNVPNSNPVTPGQTPLTPSPFGVPNDKIVTGVVLILMVLVVTILAGVNEGMGKVLVVVMGGFLLGWALTSGGQNDLTKWVGMSKTAAPTGGGGITIL